MRVFSAVTLKALVARSFSCRSKTATTEKPSTRCALWSYVVTTKASMLSLETADQLALLRSNDAPVGVQGEIDASGYWNIKLFKNQFQLDDLIGFVAELKLRCEREYVFFDFDPDLRYSVSDDAGECTLQVIGDPETTFTLVQR